MRRSKTPRRQVARNGPIGRTGLERGVLASCLAVLASCAPPTLYRPPSDLRAYQIVVRGEDSLSRAIGRQLRQRGFRVRAGVQGGGAPAAYLLAFTRRAAESGTPVWLYVRLADTRTGVVIANVSAPLDSLGATPDARARAIADSLAGTPSLRLPDPPS